MYLQKARVKLVMVCPQAKWIKIKYDIRRQ